MSIINDALKKTEESIKKNSLRSHGQPDKKSKLKLYLFYILIFIAALLLSSHVFKIINRRSPSPPVPEQPEAAPGPDEESLPGQTPPLAPPDLLPEEQPKPEKIFILNGIFFSDNNGYALVNNQIVKENDLVNGAKVEKITMDTVELNNEGKIITLSTGK
ncbi:MAG: hypothetical protein WC571_02685 [Candidatus Omnitrophota bacterium]